MANIVKTTNFIGLYRLSQNSYNTTDLESYIAKLEPYYLEKLLGAWLYNKLVADLDASGDPQTTKYKNLVNGVTYEDCDGITNNYRGLKEMLLRLIFVDFTSSSYYNSSVGNVKPGVENATVLSNYENRKILVPISQDAINIYRTTIKYLSDSNNQDTYFEDNQYSKWLPIYIEPLTLIGTKTLENKHFKNYPNDRN